MPALRVAWRRERVGDLLTVCGDLKGAAEAYLQALSDLAALSMPEGEGHGPEIEAKLRRALDGG